MHLAEVYINIPVKRIAKSYTYIVPPSLGIIERGHRVLVPFGRRKIEGFVIAISEVQKPSKDYDLKEIIDLIDEEAWFSPKLLEAVEKLADFYLASPAEMMRLFMPGKSATKIMPIYLASTLADKEINPEQRLLLDAMPYREIYDLIKVKAKSLSEIKASLPSTLDISKADLAVIIEKMLSYKLCHKDYLVTKRERIKYSEHYVREIAITDALLENFTRRKAQQKALRLFKDNKELSYTYLLNQKITRATLKNLVAEALIKCVQKRELRDTYKIDYNSSDAPKVKLTAEQEIAVTELKAAATKGQYAEYLMHGVTGSGKTRVYIEITRRIRGLGKEVIVLVPEIALTGQLVRVFQEEFAGDIVVLHSQLSLAERNDAIFRVRQREAGVIIGARSALFTPTSDLGLIILDEEQDMSYKQDEAPRYHARTVAEILARTFEGLLLLGSATPSLESYAKAKAGRTKLLTLKERVGSIPLPEIELVDMREELKIGLRNIISRPLHNLLLASLESKEQAIIMLNRRGYSTFVMCRACGEALKCSNCHLPLIYHQDGTLLCHHCDIRSKAPKICPKCSSQYIKYFGSGTEKLEEELKRDFPKARVIRMDRDTTGRRLAHQEILEAFRRREYDILLGTQMVAKGHDLPGVRSVGIISADSSLNLPDFRSSERCFMLITQTAGRAGRHKRDGLGDEALDIAGRVIVQTYSPEHYAVQTAIKHDYESFFAHELKLRRELFYPPFSRLVKLLFSHKNKDKAKELALAIITSFECYFAKDKCSRNEIIGPSPALIAKLSGYYRYVVLIKTANLPSVQAFLRQEDLQRRDEVQVDIDPVTIF